MNLLRKWNVNQVVETGGNLIIYILWDEYHDDKIAKYVFFSKMRFDVDHGNFKKKNILMSE